MELKLEDIGFDQLMEVIRHLPDDKKSQIQAELATPKKEDTEASRDEFLNLLLNGPTIDDEQYKEYKKIRKHFNRWRTK